jgi:hypothetical protein
MEWIRKACCLSVMIPLLHAQGIPPAGNPAPQEQPRSEYQIYASARTVIDWTPEEIIARYPELAKIQFSGSQEPLNTLLPKVAENVETFFRDFPNTASTERVRRERLRNIGTFEDRIDEKFNYIALLRPEGSGEFLREDRSSPDGKPADSRKMPGGSLITSGFASISLMFHPKFLSHANFRYLGFLGSNPGSHMVAFAQKPAGLGLSGSFEAEGRSGHILQQGLAWVDPATTQIVRLRTDLLAPREDLSLFRQTTDIRYSEIRFDRISRALFMPVEVIVTMEFQGFIFINRHRYSDYQLFTVETFEKREKPVIP